jgi:hypothetical protein
MNTYHGAGGKFGDGAFWWAGDRKSGHLGSVCPHLGRTRCGHSVTDSATVHVACSVAF